jgi:hypothetical protein
VTVLSTERRLWILVVLLRLAGALTITAFLAMVMPTDWMAAIHEWMGLGEFPRTAVVDYLTRSVAALYGFHGALLLIVARDPATHATIVRFLGAMNVLFGLFMIAIDAHAGMPPLWTALEGPPIVLFGVVVLWLSQGLGNGRRATVHAAVHSKGTGQ